MTVALQKVRGGELQQERYLRRVAEAHKRLADAGFDTSPSDTQIVPIGLDDERSALECSAHLESRAILAVAIRPPTVPAGTSRLRISLSRLHTRDHVTALIGALSEFCEQRPSPGGTGP